MVKIHYLLSGIIIGLICGAITTDFAYQSNDIQNNPIVHEFKDGTKYIDIQGKIYQLNELKNVRE